MRTEIDVAGQPSLFEGLTLIFSSLTTMGKRFGLRSLTVMIFFLPGKRPFTAPPMRKAAPDEPTLPLRFSNRCERSA
nr:hypothetical protein [Actinomycetota bacterium]